MSSFKNLRKQFVTMIFATSALMCGLYFLKIQHAYNEFRLTNKTFLGTALKTTYILNSLKNIYRTEADLAQEVHTGTSDTSDDTEENKEQVLYVPHDNILELYSKNQSDFKRMLFKSMRLQTWCKKYQKPNTTFSQYMDKHNIKLLLPSMAPTLTFAKEYGFVENASEINEEFLSKLPQDYMMKPAHLSGGNVKINGNTVILLGKKEKNLLRQANETALSYLQRLCNYNLRKNYTSVANEIAYKFIPKKCIFEEQLNMEGVQDYKAWVFNGRVMFVHIDTGRFGFHQKNIRTTNWVEIQGMGISGPESGNGRFQLPKKPPDFWDSLLTHANQIGRHFKHARIDFMVFNNTYIFGEITQCHNGCTSQFSPKILEHYYGFLLTHANITSIAHPDFVLKLLAR